jgi:hypothetical protein
LSAKVKVLLKNFLNLIPGQYCLASLNTGEPPDNIVWQAGILPVNFLAVQRGVSSDSFLPDNINPADFRLNISCTIKKPSHFCKGLVL